MNLYRVILLQTDDTLQTVTNKTWENALPVIKGISNIAFMAIEYYILMFMLRHYSIWLNVLVTYRKKAEKDRAKCAQAFSICLKFCETTAICYIHDTTFRDSIIC